MVTDFQQDELENQCQKTIRRRNHGALNFESERKKRLIFRWFAQKLNIICKRLLGTLEAFGKKYLEIDKMSLFGPIFFSQWR